MDREDQTGRKKRTDSGIEGDGGRERGKERWSWERGCAGEIGRENDKKRREGERE